MGPVRSEIRGRVALVTVENPPVNALSHAVRTGLSETFADLAKRHEVAAVVLAAAGRTFIAGADISEFGKGLKPPSLTEVVDQIEAFDRPVVAALHGTVLGGGLEVALGCHYRIAAPGTLVGLPEVKLGILPGAGGTQRLPRIVGPEKALNMIVSGNPIGAEAALADGVVDRLAPSREGLLDAALAFAEELAASGAGPRRTSERTIDAASVSPGLFDKARSTMTVRHSSGPVAPRACIDAVEAAVKLRFAEGIRREHELFQECYRSPYAPALWHVFFAERAAAQIPDIGPEVKPRPVNSAGVIGAGTMGRGIAMALASGGIAVAITDQSPDLLEKALADIRQTIEGQAKRGRFSAAEASRRLQLIQPASGLDALSNVDLVIEAVFENMAIKREVFGRLDKICRKGAILATNTSTLDIDAIAAATRRPEDVIGLHFFSPAHIMRLLEVVRGEKTAKDVIATSMQLAKRIGKVAVLARVCDGFIGNRMLEPYLAASQVLILEGATPAQVDRALRNWGFAMGPFEMGDLAGLDVGYRVRQERQLSPEARRLYAVPDALHDLGRHGQKTGAGYYRYAPGDRTPQPDPEIEALIRAKAAEQGIPQHQVSDEEIVERCLLALGNEGAELLGEGIALRAGDIDIVWINGYGFPAWRGGPMWQLQYKGLPAVLERLKDLESRYGARWTPAPLIERLAREGGNLLDFKAPQQSA